MEHCNVLFDAVVIHAEEILLLPGNLDLLDHLEGLRCVVPCHSISIINH